MKKITVCLLFMVLLALFSGFTEENLEASERDDPVTYEAGEFDFCEDFPPYWYQAYPLLIHEDGKTTMAVYDIGDQLAIDINDERVTYTNDIYGEEVGHCRHRYYCEDGSELTVAYADTENVVRFDPAGDTPGEGLYQPVLETTDSASDDFGVSSQYICPESDSRYLTEDEVAGIDHDFLRLARNEIYARHGRIFESDDLKKYFESKSWYSGTVQADDFDEGVFNKYERHNIELIEDFEEQYGIR